MDEVNERRAEFVYNAARIAAIGSNAPIIPAIWIEREEPFRSFPRRFARHLNR